MSTTTLPSYPADRPDLLRSPTYTDQPNDYEHRLAYSALARPSSSDGGFVKHSKHGGVSLRLASQTDGVALPLYGQGAFVEGTVDLSDSKAESVQSVEVTMEGILKMKELAEMGTAAHTLCLDRVVLWTKGAGSQSCPNSLSFSLQLPSTFNDGKGTYPLPPTFECKMTGVPAFHASTAYSVTVSVVKGKGKSSRFGIGNTSVSTPFVYVPRTRPAVPLPRPLVFNTDLRGFPEDQSGWSIFRTTIEHSMASNGEKHIACNLHVPSTRTYAMTATIPFHISFVATSTEAIAEFARFAPPVGAESWNGSADESSFSSIAKRRERVRVLVQRRSECDVKNEGIKGKEMWRIDTVGEGVFDLAASGPDFCAYNGHIDINDNVKVPGFKAGGLHIKDVIVLSMTPADPPRTAKTILREDVRAPFHPLWEAFEIRLTTDAHSEKGASSWEYGAGEVRRGAEY